MQQEPFAFFPWMCTSRQGSSVSSEDRGIHSKLHDLYCSVYRSLHLLWEVSKLNPACVFDFFPSRSLPLASLLSLIFRLFPFSLMCSRPGKAIQVRIEISQHFCFELLGQGFSVQNHAVMEFYFIYKIKENEFCT